MYINECPEKNFNWTLIENEEKTGLYRICLARDEQGYGRERWSVSLSDEERDGSSNYAQLSKEDRAGEYWTIEKKIDVPPPVQQPA